MISRLQTFIRWLFPATAKTVSRREGARRIQEAEDRFQEELKRLKKAKS